MGLVYPVIPSRSADRHVVRLIASDDEYSLFSVVIFKRVHDDFAQKCRDNKSVLCSGLSRIDIEHLQ